MEIFDLPDEICFRIFSYIPAMDLAANVSRVCVYWHSFSNDEYIWKYHCLTRWGYWKHAQEQIENPNVSWLNFFKINCLRGNLSFLILGAEGGGTSDERLFDVQSKLQLGGLVNVEVFNVRMQTPSPEYLRKFNAVLFFSYHGFDQVSLGNLLADFVEMGGGVVFCAYGNCGRGNRLDGRWAAKKYDPLILGNTSRSPYLTLGKVMDARHPILDGVTTFEGGEQSSHGDGPAHQNATVIAEWSNGRPLAVELRIRNSKNSNSGVETSGSLNSNSPNFVNSPNLKASGGEMVGNSNNSNSSSKNSRTWGEIVGLNMYPPSSDAAPGGWNASTQGAKLMANALYYVARGS